MMNRGREEVRVGDTSTETSYLTVSQVAALLQVSNDWVYTHRSKIGGVKLGGIIRFDSRIVEQIKGFN